MLVVFTKKLFKYLQCILSILTKTKRQFSFSLNVLEYALSKFVQFYTRSSNQLFLHISTKCGCKMQKSLIVGRCYDTFVSYACSSTFLFLLHSVLLIEFLWLFYRVLYLSLIFIHHSYIFFSYTSFFQRFLLFLYFGHGSKKQSPRTVCCIFLRYSQIQKSYQCYYPINFHSVNVDVAFCQSILYFPNSKDVTLYLH